MLSHQSIADTFHDFEPDPMMDCILDRCVRADWIEEFFFQKERGYKIRWTPKGEQRAVILEELIEQYQLGIPAHAKAFTRCCLDPSPGHTGSDDDQCDFWRSCLDELALGNEECALGALVRLIQLHPHDRPTVRIISPR